MGGSFVCVCPEHQAPSGEDWAASQPELERQLHEVQPVVGSSKVLICPGAGLATVDSGSGSVLPFTLAVDGCVTAFIGVLDNLRAVQKLVGQQDVSEIHRSSPEPAALQKLYHKLGPCMVSELQGDFAFVLHDSSMGQTIAARSAGSSAHLSFGRTADGSLAVAGATAGMPRLGSRVPGLKLPSGWHGFQNVPAGCYICAHNGGRVQQFEFSTPDHGEAHARQARNSTALNAHMIATGTLHGNGSSDGTISFDGSAGKKTRRGKRAGRNVKDRASFEGRRASSDSGRRDSADGRPSMDAQRASRDARSPDSATQLQPQRPSADLARVVDASRADQDRWWRRSIDEEQKPQAVPVQDGHGAGPNQAPLPDTLAVVPPKDLTIPEHPEGQVDLAAQPYIRRRSLGCASCHQQQQGQEAPREGSAPAYAPQGPQQQPRPRRRMLSPVSSFSPTAAAAAAAALALLPPGAGSGTKMASEEGTRSKGSLGPVSEEPAAAGHRSADENAAPR